MTTWTKIEPNVGRLAGRKAADYPRVANYKKSSVAHIALPRSFGFEVGDKVDILTDNDGRIAYMKGGSSYSAVRLSNTSAAVKITIPAQFRKIIPQGTTRCKLTVVDGGVILDLSQFAPKAAPVAATRNPFTSVAAE